MRPGIILGFGRSGTTWLADVISKATGRLVLFEPLHPDVAGPSYSYSWSYRAAGSAAVRAHLDDVLAKRCRRPWLLRNHLSGPLGQTSPAELDYLWEHCEIGGFKEIRLNFAIPWLAAQDIGPIVFIVRHPYAVITSTLNRPNFWEYAVMEATYGMILAHCPAAINPVQWGHGAVARLAVMWSITHVAALPACREHGVPVFTYESLEADPFEAAKTVLRASGVEDRPLHPSYVLADSQTTHNKPRFWKRQLSDAERAMIDEIVHSFGLTYPPLAMALTAKECEP